MKFQFTDLLKNKWLLFALLFFSGFATSGVHAQYCIGTYGNACSSGDLINNFSFNTIVNNGTGCNGQTNNYIYYSTLSTNVSAGQTYNMSMQSGSAWSQGFGVWIDWNRDNDFDDVGEFVYASPTASTTAFNTTVTVPLTAVPGTTRLRVRCSFGGTVTSTDACSGLTWGETEDYNVNILTPSANDIGITSIIQPSSGCNLSCSDTVTVNVTNFGSNSQTGFNVHYRLNGGAVVTENVGSSVFASGATSSFSFATTASFCNPGTYVVEAWTTLATDTIGLNDTSVVSVTSVPGVSTYPYFEDFESGNGGWLSGGASSTWAFGTPAKTTIQGAYSGDSAWVTGGLGTTQYNNNEDSYILGPCFNFATLTSDPWISFRIWWNSEPGWDGGNLQYSTDFGATWSQVGTFGDPNNWYNDASIVGQPGGDNEGWSGRITSSNGSGGWVLASHELTGLAGEPSVRLRYNFGSDGSVTDDGIAIDNIAIGYPPTTSIGPDSSICGGDTIFLDAGPNPNGRYFWSTGNTARFDTITVNNIGNGTVSVIFEDSLGFQAFDTMQVTISVPTVFLGPDTSICVGDTLNYGGGNPGATYLWHTGQTDSSIAVTSTAAVWVQVTDTVGCVITDTVNVNTYQAVSVNLGNDTTACVGTPVTLDAGAQPLGSVYDWSTGAFTQVLIATGPGVYWCEVVTPDGCADRDSVIVNTLPNPAVSLGPDTIACDNFLLDAGAGAASYSWSTGASSQSITGTTSGTYAVQVTNSLGCSSTDTVVITVVQGPVVNLGGPHTLCNGQAITLDAGNAGSAFQWSTGDQTQTTQVSAVGNYLVTVTDGNGCSTLDSTSVIASPLTVNLGPDRDICNNNSLLLDAGNPGLTFLWSDNSTSQTLTVSSAGTYWVAVTDQQGCTATDSILVGQRTGLTAAFSAPGSASLGVGVPFTDNSAGTPISWEWDFGDGTQFSTQQNPTHTFNALGVFTVQLIVNDGYCSDTTTQDVEVNNVIGIEELDWINNLQVYPNPSGGIFNLDMELVDAEAVSFEIVDLQGRVLRREGSSWGTNHHAVIDLAGQSKGLYLLRVKAGGKVAWSKLILQ